MASNQQEPVFCRGCGLQGPSLEIVHHYLWEELPAHDVPFQCRECNARFHRRRVAVWHMEVEHGCRKPILDAFNGTLRDLPVYKMVQKQLPTRRKHHTMRGRRRFRRHRSPLASRPKATPATSSRRRPAPATTSQTQTHTDGDTREMPREQASETLEPPG